MEEVCKASFPQVELQNYFENSTLPILNFNPKASIDGRTNLLDRIFC
jgi:hypothetical protein